MVFVDVLGEIEGFGKLKLITTEIDKAIKDINVLIYYIMNREETKEYYKHEAIKAEVDLRIHAEHIRCLCKHTPVGNEIWIDGKRYILKYKSHIEAAVKLAGKGKMPIITVKFKMLLTSRYVTYGFNYYQNWIHRAFEGKVSCYMIDHLHLPQLLILLSLCYIE